MNLNKTKDTIWEALTWVVLIFLTFITVCAFPWDLAQRILQYLFLVLLAACIFWYLRSRGLYFETLRKTTKLIKKQEEIENRNEIMNLIFNHSEDGILVLDKEKRIESFSPGLEKLTGLKKDNVLGRLASEELRLESNDMILTDAIFLPENAKEFPYVKNILTTSSGAKIPFEASYVLIKNDDGEIDRGLAIIRELTHDS
jgi:PAS domain S-box-containing protein